MVEDNEGELIAWGTTQKGQVRNGTERENFCERGHEGRHGREASKLPTQAEKRDGGSGFGSYPEATRRKEGEVTCGSSRIQVLRTAQAGIFIIPFRGLELKVFDGTTPDIETIESVHVASSTRCRRPITTTSAGDWRGH